MLKLHSHLKIVLMAIAMVSACVAFLAAGEKQEVFKGEISDSQCAFNVHSTTHSHAEMLKTHTMGNTPADCVRMCVDNLGGVYVLQTKDKVYKLDKQNLAERYPAQAVKVTGLLNAKGDTIAVQSIVPSNAE
ncbi:MAG TPA: hypothetical protein VGR97_09665 [Candidatus Acidoferrales bacterium]|nr:hypothetical protein [Candidatus Acidoferrales bacterium]